MLKKILILTFFLGYFSDTYAQLINNGEKIVISNDAIIFIAANYTHSAGSILNNGRISIQGHWVNNDLTSLVFDPNSTGTVNLTGDNQNISGFGKTAFPGLTLAGTGSKRLEISSDVRGMLLLNDRELQAGQFALSVLNPDPAAISRITGFISTDQNGKVIRHTNSTGSYLFPLGTSNSSSGILYRPVIIEPQNSGANTFGIGFYDADPSTQGYNRNSKRPDIQTVFDHYFYTLNQETGTSPISVKFYQNTSMEGDYNQLVNWNNYLLWEKSAPSLIADGNFGDGLNRSLLFTATQPVNNLPLAYANATTANDPLTFFNAFSPDGDGKNDRWEIKNLDIFPDNELSIYNRWGDEVFRSKSYSSIKAWDGGNFNAGTYYYVLKVNISGSVKTYKGFITMIKNN